MRQSKYAWKPQYVTQPQLKRKSLYFEVSTMIQNKVLFQKWHTQKGFKQSQTGRKGAIWGQREQNRVMQGQTQLNKAKRGQMGQSKTKQRKNFIIFYLLSFSSSLILYPLSFITYSLSFTPYPISLIHYVLSIIQYPQFLNP